MRRLPLLFVPVPALALAALLLTACSKPKPPPTDLPPDPQAGQRTELRDAQTGG